MYFPLPSILPFRPGDPTSAAHALCALEKANACRGAEQTTTPFFADNQGRPYTHSTLDLWFRHLLHMLYDHKTNHKTARVYSWHSLRIGMVCALRAAGCPDENIPLICR
eukprot:5281726-Pleurochrysis_carterae.AAC.2